MYFPFIWVRYIKMTIHHHGTDQLILTYTVTSCLHAAYLTLHMLMLWKCCKRLIALIYAASNAATRVNYVSCMGSKRMNGVMIQTFNLMHYHRTARLQKKLCRCFLNCICLLCYFPHLMTDSDLVIFLIIIYIWSELWFMEFPTFETLLEATAQFFCWSNEATYSSWQNQFLITWTTAAQHISSLHWPAK